MSDTTINLKSFPLIKVISSIFFILGGILTYIYSSRPEVLLFQIGGVQINLILGIFPILSGIGLLFYAILKFYDITLKLTNESIIVKAKKEEIKIAKDQVKAIRIRDAGKSIPWFVFLFVNFYFVYYGIECALYFSANHNAGLLEYVIYPMFIVWIASLLLVLFPRKLLMILTDDKAVLQKINHLPKDGSFEEFADKLFGFSTKSDENYDKNYHFLFRLILGLIFLVIFIMTSMIVDINGINRPLHDLGIFIPIFLLFFSVFTISSALREGLWQNIDVQGNKLRIEEKTSISKITGKNFVWIKAKNKIERREVFEKGFRPLKTSYMLLIFVIFGQALFLAFKFLWLPTVYLKYLDVIDIFIGVIMLVVILLYAFEIVVKVNVFVDSEFKFKREIIIGEFTLGESLFSSRNFTNRIKKKVKEYIKNGLKLAKKNENNHTLKIITVMIASIFTITLSFYLLGFVIFFFI